MFWRHRHHPGELAIRIAQDGANMLSKDQAVGPIDDALSRSFYRFLFLLFSGLADMPVNMAPAVSKSGLNPTSWLSFLTETPM